MTITVTNVLWGDAHRAGESLARRLCKEDVSSAALASSPSVNPRAYPVLDERISEVLRGAVEVDLCSVVITAWTGYQALRDAGARTRDGGPPVDVVLAEHEITSAHQPVVEIQVNGSTVNTLTFDLVLSLLVRSLIAVVDGGKLVGLRGGQVVVVARLELRGTVLARGEHTCTPGALVTLGDGVQLVGGVPLPTSPAAASPAAASPAAANLTTTGAPTSTAGPVPAWVSQVSAPGTSAPSANPVPRPPDPPWWEHTAAAGGPASAPAWWETRDDGGHAG